MQTYIEKQIASLKKTEQRLEEELQRITWWVEKGQRDLELILSFKPDSPELNTFWNENRQRILEWRTMSTFDDQKESDKAIKLWQKLNKVQRELWELEYRAIVHRNAPDNYSKFAIAKFVVVVAIFSFIVHEAFALNWGAAAIVTILSALFYERINYIASVNERTYKMILAFEVDKENREKHDIPGWNFVMLQKVGWLEDRFKEI